MSTNKNQHCSNCKFAGSERFLQAGVTYHYCQRHKRLDAVPLCYSCPDWEPVAEDAEKKLNLFSPGDEITIYAGENKIVRAIVI